MEPRSFDRGGTLTGAVGTANLKGVSMEPRSFDRGGPVVVNPCGPRPREAFCERWRRSRVLRLDGG